MQSSSDKLSSFFGKAKNLHHGLLEENDLCLFEMTMGFHAQDPLYITRETINLQQCVLLCLKLALCLSGNFLEMLDSQNVCTLHTSNPYVLNTEIPPNSISFEFKCRQKPHIITRFVDIMPLPTTCGVAMKQTQRNNELLRLQHRYKRIVGGFETQFYSQPWHGLVFEKGKHVCGAALIALQPNDKSTNWAISAAHCLVELRGHRKIVPTLNHYVFIFGIQDLRVFTPHIFTRKAKKILWPAKYGDTPKINDVALIEFTEEITFSMYVLPICLPQAGPNYDEFLDSAECYICGYGFTKDQFPLTTKEQSNLPNRLQCIRSVAERRSSSDLLIREWSNKIDYKGLSLGDSGGGYVCKEYEQSPFIMIGVINGREVNKFYFNKNSQPVYYYYSYSAFLPEYIDWVNRKINGIVNDGEMISTCAKCWQ